MGASVVQRRQPEGRREQILAAAREVLSEHGYERTTVSQIASRAQVAQGTFYLYFPSKEALPGELALELCREMGAATDRATEHDALDEAVDALIADVFACAHEQRDVLREANRGIELAATYEDWARITEPWRSALERFLGKFQAAGALGADVDVVTMAFVLRDLLDRAAKAQVLFDHHDYASATALLVRRALAP